MRLQNTSRQTKISRLLFLLPPLARIASLVLDVQQLLRHRADPRACLARQDAGKLRSAIQVVKPRGRWPESNPRGRGASAKPFAPLRAPGARRPWGRPEAKKRAQSRYPVRNPFGVGGAHLSGVYPGPSRGALLIQNAFERVEDTASLLAPMDSLAPISPDKTIA